MWLLAATARPLQPLTRDCDEDVWFRIDISPHSEVTACRCKLSAKAASEHRIMACRRVPCYDLKLEQSEGTVWLSVGEVR